MLPVFTVPFSTLRCIAIIAALGTITACEVPQSQTTSRATPTSRHTPRTTRPAKTPRLDRANSLQRVQYISDSIVDVNDGLLSLLDGSLWLTSKYSMLLPISDILIVMTDDQNGVAYSDGVETAVQLKDGLPFTQTGLLGKVVEANQSGSRLILNDGSIWSVDDYDQFDTGWWLPPYSVMVTSNELYLINLQAETKVWVTRVR